eukprot:1156433-Pelagomonas_calceolata.AAC.6
MSSHAQLCLNCIPPPPCWLPFPVPSPLHIQTLLAATMQAPHFQKVMQLAHPTISNTPPTIHTLALSSLLSQRGRWQQHI